MLNIYERTGFVLKSSIKKEADKTYVPVKENMSSLLSRHSRFMKANSIEDAKDLPFLYWIPKMHKKPYSKQRYIAASARCSTKPLSAILTKCLKLIEGQHRIIGKRYFTNHGINPMWIINNSTAVHNMIADLNSKKQVRNIRTYDFSTLYTSIPHKQLKTQLSLVIKDAFIASNKSYISVYDNDAKWTNSPKKTTLALDCKKVIRLLNWLIDNILSLLVIKCSVRKLEFQWVLIALLFLPIYFCIHMNTNGSMSNGFSKMTQR
jgi:hypothetical protein